MAFRIAIFAWFLGASFYLTGCIEHTERYYLQSVGELTWAPDQESIYFTYTNYKQPITPLSSAIQHTAIYKVNLNGTGLEKIYEPSLDSEGKKTAIIYALTNILGWFEAKLVFAVNDTLYVFDQKKNALETDQRHQNLAFHKAWLVHDKVLTSVSLNQRLKSFVVSLNDPDYLQSFKFDKLSGKDELYKGEPYIEACSPDGKHVSYRISSSGEDNEDELGLAELDIGVAELRNPSRFLQAVGLPSSRSEPWAWIAPGTLLYIEHHREPGSVLVKETSLTAFHYPDRQSKLDNRFLLSKPVAAVSPDYKRVVYAEHGKILIADIDGSNSTSILDYVARLPRGDVQ